MLDYYKESCYQEKGNVKRILHEVDVIKCPANIPY